MVARQPTGSRGGCAHVEAGGPDARSGVPDALTRAALAADTRAIRLRTLVHALPALDLRLARILAWLRGQDLASLGVPGWTAFLRERVDWGESWVRDMMRLVRSGLLVVVRAACEGRVALSLAAKAPGWCPPDAQEAWVEAAIAGTLPPRPRAKPRGASFTIEPDDPDALVVWHARRKARLLTGLPLSDREADARMLAWWREERGDLVEEALAPAPRPVATPWVEWEFQDPATALLGPWRTPTSLEEAIAALDAVQEARRARVHEVARLYEAVVREGLHRAWGYRDVETFCATALGVSARTLQRYRELGRTLRRFPALEALPASRAEAIARVATDDDVARWVAVAGRTGAGELSRAVAHVAAGADREEVLGAYEAAMARATGTVALEGIQGPVPATQTDRVHPDLPAAARWLLFEVTLPRQRGFGKVKERDRYVCGNPECRRLALRNQAHHLLERARGGPDAAANGVCACPSCHLRLVHPGHLRVARVGDALVWTWRDGRTVTVFPGPAGLALPAARRAG